MLEKGKSYYFILLQKQISTEYKYKKLMDNFWNL